MNDPVPRVGVSRCLLGEAVRYDGDHRRQEWIVSELAAHAVLVAVCPETSAGLGVPREPVHLAWAPEDGPRVRGNDSGRDFTAALERGVMLSLEHLGTGPVDGCLLKARSPSCGRAVEVAGSEAPAPGVFAAALEGAWPLAVTAEADALEDPAAREAFCIRVFARARLRALFSGAWTPGDLAAFHAREKMLLLVHGRTGYARLGRLVAEAGRWPREALAGAYTRRFMETLESTPTRGRYVDALQHMAGHLRGRLDPLRRARVRESIEDYRRGARPRPQVLASLHALAGELDLVWVRDQTCLAPCPPSLLARD
ncbi:MAG: YbgA family protein [Ectothiorhodospira sp.]